MFKAPVNPDEFYVHKPLLLKGKEPIVRRSIGSKKIKMVFSKDTQAGLSTITTDVDEKDSNKFCISDEDIIDDVLVIDPLQMPNGHRMGKEWN